MKRSLGRFAEAYLVSLASLRRSFAHRTVLRDISLSVDPNTTTAILGPNGSGKTTLLRIIAGTLTPDSGTVTVCDAPPGRGFTALVPSGDRGLYWRLTARENLEFCARVSGMSRTDAAESATRTAETVNAHHLLDRRVGTCSTGERRRIAIACGFVRAAPVVLIDEPFEDLDEDGRDSVRAATKTWTDAGGIVIYAAPDDTGGPPADVILEIRDGAVSERG